MTDANYVAGSSMMVRAPNDFPLVQQAFVLPVRQGLQKREKRAGLSSAEGWRGSEFV